MTEKLDWPRRGLSSEARRLQSLVRRGTWGVVCMVIIVGASSCASLPPGVQKVARDCFDALATNFAPPASNVAKSLLDVIFRAAEEPEEPQHVVPDESQEKLGLKVVFYRVDERGRAIGVIRDGDTLSSGDQYKIQFSALTDCYVYLVGVDGAGWVQGYFPQSPTQNPVGAGLPMDVPRGSYTLELDESVGVETFYFVVSRRPRRDLEEKLAALLVHKKATSWSPDLPAAKSVTVVRQLDTSASQVSENTAGVRAKGAAPLESVRFLAPRENGELVVTRWFHHQ